MQDLKSIRDIFRKLSYILSRRQAAQGLGVFVLSLVCAVLELFGVSAIVPLIRAMVSPETLLGRGMVGRVLRLLGVDGYNKAIWTVCTGIIIIYAVKNIVSVLLSYSRARYANAIKRDLSTRMMNAYMSREYEFFLRTGIGELTQGVESDAAGVYELIYQGLRIVEQGLIVLVLGIYIAMEDIIMAVGILSVALLCMLIVMVLLRSRVRQLGVEKRKFGGSLTKFMLEAFGGIKDIMVMRRQSYFRDRYEDQFRKVEKNGTASVVAAESPAQLIEAFSVAGIMVAVAVRVTTIDDPGAYVPQLAAFALAAFRMLPSLGKVSNAFSHFMLAVPRLNRMYENYKEAERYVRTRKRRYGEEKPDSSRDTAEEAEDRGPFEVLEVNDLHWTYAGTDKEVLRGLNLEIRRGESVGIIGMSGAGKSTLMDSVLGLLEPKEGSIRLDGRNIYSMPGRWARTIGYVPQSVYLLDESVRRNVAFGIPDREIDDVKVWKALKQAQIDDFVRGLPNGLDTSVGDRGVRFSGGQRQRIAIARALYHDPAILIFDEATSALDNETEAAVMDSIEALRGVKTLIIVAHRLTTLENCDVIYEVRDGQAVWRDKEALMASLLRHKQGLEMTQNLQ